MTDEAEELRREIIEELDFIIWKIQSVKAFLPKYKELNTATEEIEAIKDLFSKPEGIILPPESIIVPSE